LRAGRIVGRYKMAKHFTLDIAEPDGLAEP